MGPIGYTNPDLKRSAQLWSEEEDLLLVQSRLAGELWTTTRARFPQRTPRSIQAHYGTLKQEIFLPKRHAKLEHESKLKQEENGADEANTLRRYTWTKDEDEVIRGWTDIKSAGKIFKKYFPARSENGGRNRMKCLREEATRAGWTNERGQKLRECRDETGAGWDEEVLRLNSKRVNGKSTRPVG
jgi:hypothetical protein